ncbi:hypothetical protein SRRS_49140 [Sporomusa rhizae]
MRNQINKKHVTEYQELTDTVSIVMAKGICVKDKKRAKDLWKTLCFKSKNSKINKDRRKYSFKLNSQLKGVVV